MSSNKKVIYTAIFGTEYYLHEPEVPIEGYDFICFTNDPSLKSDLWDVRQVTPIYKEADGALTRNARKYKSLPHRYLKEYDISIWMDGDLKITDNLDLLTQEHLKENNLALLDHSLCGMTTTGNLNRRSCVYDEAKFIKWAGDNHPRKSYKDNINIILSQMEKYQKEGYPPNNGLARTSMIFRKHNDPQIIKTMELWWEEMKYGSRRDQLSFNYSAWKNGLSFTYIQEDIDDNKWIKLMKRWRQHRKKEKQKALEFKKQFQPINLDYFLNMELANGGGGKEIIKGNGELKTVRDIVNFFKTHADEVEKTLVPSNWQYFNCMMAEFRHNVENHHDLGWENMTKEYYESLDLMSDEEIEQFLKDNPVEFDNGFIRHNYHRACAMIGRLIKGKLYIPFYMKTSQIYDEARKKDGLHRVKPLTSKIKLLEEMDRRGISRDDYCLAQSSILSIMGIRDNDDLDIIISSKLRSQNLQFPPGVDVFAANRGKFNYFGAKGDDDILENYCIKIDGYKFLEPRFYFARKNRSTERDVNDWKSIELFFMNNNHKGYPFNFDFYKWGVNYVNKVQLKDLNVNNLKTIISKYNRIIEGINHGRSVFYDEENKRYIKIFHPEYCRIDNFKEALSSGFLNGLCPSLTDLIYNGGNLVGYICKEGSTLLGTQHPNRNVFKHSEEIPQDFLTTILKNCNKRKKVYYDLSPSNIIKLDNGQYSLIDLESVYDLDNLDILPLHNAQVKPSNLLELIEQA